MGGQAKVAGLQPMAVAVSPAPDLKATLPGSAGPKVAPLADIYKAARSAFPGVRLGGGMFSYFAELNRKRPPVELLDYVTHTNAPIVHAADDISVMETLEALPYVIDFTRSFIGKKTPYWVGPSSIAARDNPYGAATAANPDNQRICLADRDPRHRGLFGAAWSLGYIAAFARGGVEAVNLAAATGPRGLLYRPTDTPQPYFDDVKRGFYPLYHVIAGLAGAAGKKQIAADSALPTKVASVAYRDTAGPVVWLANLTGEKQAVQIKGFKPGPVAISQLDEGSFAAATKRQDFLGKLMKKVKKMPASIPLRPYAVVRVGGNISTATGRHAGPATMAAETRGPLLGCIADDFTGATDLANTLVQGRHAAVQVIGVPAMAAARGRCRHRRAEVAHRAGRRCGGAIAGGLRCAARRRGEAALLQILLDLRQHGCRAISARSPMRC